LYNTTNRSNGVWAITRLVAAKCRNFQTTEKRNYSSWGAPAAGAPPAYATTPLTARNMTNAVIRDSYKQVLLLYKPIL